MYAEASEQFRSLPKEMPAEDFDEDDEGDSVRKRPDLIANFAMLCLDYYLFSCNYRYYKMDKKIL